MCFLYFRNRAPGHIVRLPGKAPSSHCNPLLLKTKVGMSVVCILSCGFLFPLGLSGQHSVKHSNAIWSNYNNSIRLDSHWSVVNDVQVRTKDGIDKWSLFALRTGAVYKPSQHVAVAGGIAWFGTMNYFPDKTLLANEWRTWEEVSYINNVKLLKITQRVRLEQRFLQKLLDGKRTHDFETRQRLRYRFEVGYPVYNEKVMLYAGNEVMGNLNYLKDNRFFDQNRTFLTVETKLTGSTTFQFQYIRLQQWRAATNVLEIINVFRGSIHQRF